MPWWLQLQTAMTGFPVGGTMTFLSETPERILPLEALFPIGFGSRRSSD